MSKVKLDFKPQKKNSPAKRYVCIDLEMTEFYPRQRRCLPGAKGELIQFGAVILDENYNMISKFYSYVKPVYSSVTTSINELTGISNVLLEKADDFITVFDKFCFWSGDGNLATFCWSSVDFNQLWAEFAVKGKHRDDLFCSLHDFVDLQQIFCKLVSSKSPVRLERTVKLLQMGYKGQVHSALSDSYNTARILHKLFCTESLKLDFAYINPTRKNFAEKNVDEDYSCPLASFVSPELLAQFCYAENSLEKEEPDEYSYEDAAEDLKVLEDSPLAGMVYNDEIAKIYLKYKIEVKNWIRLATEVMATKEIQVA